MDIDENKKIFSAYKKQDISLYLTKRFSCKEDLNNFYMKYSVSTRLTVVKTRYFCEYIREVLKNLDNEFYEIQRIYGIKNGNVKSFVTSMGDTHQKGKTVIFIEIDSIKLVYKPKNLEIEQSFYTFIDWINSTAELLPINGIKSIYRKTFAIQEFVEYRECMSKEDVKRYYKRFGYLISLSYLLSGNDFHLENIVCDQDNPMLIDLETILQPERDFLNITDPDYLISQDAILNSVAGSGLLPILGFARKSGKGIDISALNGTSQKLPYKVLLPSNINTISREFLNLKT